VEADESCCCVETSSCVGVENGVGRRCGRVTTVVEKASMVGPQTASHSRPDARNSLDAIIQWYSCPVVIVASHCESLVDRASIGGVFFMPLLDRVDSRERCAYGLRVCTNGSHFDGIQGSPAGSQNDSNYTSTTARRIVGHDSLDA